MAVQRRNTRQRQLVLDTVRATSEHPTADEIYTAIRKVDEHVSRGTVYRNLNLLAEEGVIRAIKTPGGSRFDWNCSEHAHIICTSCGKVADLSLPYDKGLDTKATQDSGFSACSHYTLFEGVCPECTGR